MLETVRQAQAQAYVLCVLVETLRLYDLTAERKR